MNIILIIFQLLSTSYCLGRKYEQYLKDFSQFETDYFAKFQTLKYCETIYNFIFFIIFIINTFFSIPLSIYYIFKKIKLKK